MIDNNDSFKWYHGITSAKCNELLKEQRKKNSESGIFLVRSSSTYPFVLSCYTDRIRHIPIKQHGFDAFFSLNHGKIIHGLDEIIKLCQQNDDESVTNVSLKSFVFVKGDHPPLKYCKFGLNGPLHDAVLKNDLSQVTLLLSSTNDCIDDKNKEGKTALHLACIKNEIDSNIPKLLIDRNASLFLRDASGKIPFLYAVEQGQREIVKMMILKDRNVIQVRSSETCEVALHVASRTGNIKIVEMLTKNNAALFTVNNIGEFPIKLAADNKHANVVIHLSSLSQKQKNVQQNWSHGRMTRDKARSFLFYKRDELQQKNASVNMIKGIFLIRFSQKVNKNVITMLVGDEICNYEIQLTDGFFYLDNGPWHLSIDNLVSYYMNFADGLPSKLTVPLKPPEKLYDIPINSSNPLYFQKPSEELENMYSKIDEKEGDYDWLKKSTPVAIDTYVDELFINENHLEISQELLGEGKFGTVNKGILVVPGKSFYVAIKTLHVENDEDFHVKFCSFLREAGIMMRFNNPFIVKMIGITIGPPMRIVQELQKLGSLKNHLKSYADDIHPREINTWAAQIADGMSYLETKQFVHRDLATRNILLASKTHVKISDFGLSRTISVETGMYNEWKNEFLPVRWYAPECFQGVYTHASDVWSFGVTIWEAYTKGDLPYKNIIKVDEMVDYVRQGGRLIQPENCSDEIFQMMFDCWNKNGEKRPNFKELREFFEAYAPIYANVSLLES